MTIVPNFLPHQIVNPCSSLSHHNSSFSFSLRKLTKSEKEEIRIQEKKKIDERIEQPLCSLQVVSDAEYRNLSGIQIQGLHEMSVSMDDPLTHRTSTSTSAWYPWSSDRQLGVIGLRFFNEDCGVAVLNNGEVWISEDGAMSWSKELPKLPIYQWNDSNFARCMIFSRCHILLRSQEGEWYPHAKGMNIAITNS
jgi:hypothetical protein